MEEVQIADAVFKIPAAVVSDSQESETNFQVCLSYNEPTWSATPTDEYSFEVVKSGVIISSLPIKKPFIVIGRLTTCDISLEHPSISRYHAILQYCNGSDSHCKGYYIYDLGSTHGTFLNKKQIVPRTYYLVKNGHILKFGGSTRLHILQAPEEKDENVPNEKSINVLSAQESCSWGIGDDAEEEDNDLAVNPFAVCTENEDLYIDDPKKTLRGWFEREGYELEYDVEEKGLRTFVCSLKLPIDNPTGDYLTVEASVQGKKKEAVVACALEACRTLDRYGLLRQSHQSSRERKRKNWEDEDFYDSDEDTFLDRTGTIEKKRHMRMMQVKKTKPETFGSLESKLLELKKTIHNVECKLQPNISSTSSKVDEAGNDPLDSYMSEISSETVDKVTKSKLKVELSELVKEKAQVEKLLNIAKPAKLPMRKFPNIIGKKLKSKLKLPPPKPRIQNQVKNDDSAVEEEEEEEVVECIETPEESDEKINKANEKQIEGASLYADENNVVEKNQKSEEKQASSCITKASVTEVNIKEVQLPKHSTRKRDFKKRSKLANKDVYKSNDENYSMWMPPTNQTGDGSTHLNVKYGY